MNERSSLMPPADHFNLPFFDPVHRTLAADLAGWTTQQAVDESDDRRACRDWVQRLGSAGWLRYCVPASAGGALDPAWLKRLLSGGGQQR